MNFANALQEVTGCYSIFLFAGLNQTHLPQPSMQCPITDQLSSFSTGVSSVSQHFSSGGMSKAGHNIPHLSLERLSERKNNFLSPAAHSPHNAAQDTVFLSYDSTLLAHRQIHVQVS